LEKATAFASARNLSPEVKLYGSYDKLLDVPSVDVVYISLPTGLYLQWALKSSQKKIAKFPFSYQNILLSIAEILMAAFHIQQGTIDFKIAFIRTIRV